MFGYLSVVLIVGMAVTGRCGSCRVKGDSGDVKLMFGQGTGERVCIYNDGHSESCGGGSGSLIISKAVQPFWPVNETGLSLPGSYLEPRSEVFAAFFLQTALTEEQAHRASLCYPPNHRQPPKKVICIYYCT